MEYIVITEYERMSQSGKSFERQVNDKIEDGFKPLPGGFKVICDSTDCVIYFQAMIKE